ncbi:MAG TPA: peptidoglycan editing factor PgeF [Rhizomicrobium sp.]|jgi:hypothetical protein
MLRFAAENLDTAGVAHGFFGRKGGVSSGLYASLNCGPGSGDDAEFVTENRRRSLVALSPRAASLVTLYQVHGARALTVREAWTDDSRPKADAVVTDTPRVALGILTADCAPVLLADAGARVIGAAHAGWKGALAGVIESTVAAMAKLGARAGQISAGIGPCISQAAYEVGEDLRTRVLESAAENARFFMPADRSAHWRFDLRGFVRHRLAAAGVEDVADVGLCTYAQEFAFFSFRRAIHRGEPDYGRQLSAIALI